MALPGLTQSVQDGNLGLLHGSNAQQALLLGNSLGGTQGVLTAYGDQTTMAAALVGGELLEAATYVLKTGGGPVYVYPMPLTTRGGVGSVTKTGTGAGTVTLTIAPHAQITITCTTAGALGTAAFTFQIGSGAVSAPVTSAAGWSSTGYQLPGTYITIVFVAGSYVAGGTPDIYIISTLGAVTHPQGAGPAVPTFTASPVDYYTPKIQILVAGALGTMQFQYSLDGTASNMSAAIVSPGGGAYALTVPATGLGTGIVVTFASTFTTDNTYSWQCAGPTFSASDLTAAQTALQTTYLASAGYSMQAAIGSLASTAAWSTQVSALQSSAATLFNNGVYIRCFSGCPTVGTVLPNAGSITVDSADTDSVVIAGRQAMSAANVVPCAGDVLLTSPLTGLSFRRNALWPALARATKVEPSKNIGAVADGGLLNVTALYRDDNALGGTFDAVGITTCRTFPNYGGLYMVDGHTATVSTSDYYPLTNARVIDRACAIARQKGLPYVQAKLPTTTKGANVGVITEKKAQQIEKDVNGGMRTMVDNQPQDALAVSCVVNRTNNLYATGNLIMSINVQPYAYARTVTQVIGLQIVAGT